MQASGNGARGGSLTPAAPILRSASFTPLSDLEHFLPQTYVALEDNYTLLSTPIASVQ
jgi:hypothetical protein